MQPGQGRPGRRQAPTELPEAQPEVSSFLFLLILGEEMFEMWSLCGAQAGLGLIVILLP